MMCHSRLALAVKEQVQIISLLSIFIVLRVLRKDFFRVQLWVFSLCVVCVDMCMPVHACEGMYMNARPFERFPWFGVGVSFLADICLICIQPTELCIESL